MPASSCYKDSNRYVGVPEFFMIPIEEFFEIYKKKSLAYRDHDSTHITPYDPLSGFPYYNMTTLHSEGSPYPPPGDAPGSSVGLSYGTFHQ